MEPEVFLVDDINSYYNIFTWKSGKQRYYHIFYSILSAYIQNYL